jgi:hypothetical protein
MLDRERGELRVLRPESDFDNRRANPAHQNGAAAQAVREFAARGDEIHEPVSRGRQRKSAHAAKKDWVDFVTVFLTLAAAGGAITAAVFTGWLATTADEGLRAGNRAYVHSTNFQFVHYGVKNDSGRTQWTVAPLIENTGNTGTRGMQMSTVVTTDRAADFNTLANAPFSPALILPKGEMTGATFSADGAGLDRLRGGGLATMGVIRYADIFGDHHLVEFCHRAQFAPIDWEGVPIGQPLRIRGVACEAHNCEDNECGADWRVRANGTK